jgi:hypothetical protein
MYLLFPPLKKPFPLNFGLIGLPNSSKPINYPVNPELFRPSFIPISNGSIGSYLAPKGIFMFGLSIVG